MLNPNQTFNTNSIARRIIIYVIIFISFITLFATAVQLYRDFNSDINLIDEQLQQVEDVHLKSLTATLWAADLKELKTHVEGISQLRDMQSVEIRDQERLWVSAGKPQSKNVISRQYPMVYNHRGQAVEIGTLTVVASLTGVYQRLIDKVWVILISNGVKIILVAGFILLIFHALVTRHLVRIAEFAGTVDVNNLERQLSLDRKEHSRQITDELDLLVNAINHMQSSLKESLADLEASEQHFQVLAKVSPVGIYRTEAQGRCTYVNERWCELAGISEQAALGDGWHRALHSDDRDQVLKEWRQALLVRHPFRSEYRFQKPDGEIVWLLGMAEVELDKNGQMLGYVGTVTDVTAKKVTEETLRYIATGVSAETGETFLHKFVQCLAKVFNADYAFIGELDKNNPQQVNMLSVCAYGETVDNLSYSLEGAPCARVMGRDICAYPKGVQKKFPEDFLLANMDVESYIGAPLFDNKGVALGILVVMDSQPMKSIKQVTEVMGIFAARAGAELERMHAEESLRVSQKRLNYAQHMAHIGSWELDLINDQLAWSDEVYNLFEIDPTKFGASYEEFLNVIHPDDRERVSNAYQISLKNKTPYNIEHRLLMQDGTIKHVMEQCKTYYDEEGNPLRSVGIIQDITERKIMEEALRRSQKMDIIGQLSGGIAHDFNNQLGVIIGYLDFLKKYFPVDKKPRRWVDTATKATLRCMDLTRQLLSFSRRQSEEKVTVNVNACLHEMESMITRSVTPEVDVQLFLLDDLWLAEFNPGEFQDAILNMVINARDAMPKGGKFLIETTNKHVDASYSATNPEAKIGDYVQLMISDTGSGMDRATLDHVFEPFFSTKPVGKGTGLGMSMVYGFVKRYGGFVNVYSEPDVGTTFRLYLPRSAASEPSVLEANVNEADLPTGGESILIVDDETDLLQLADQYLSDLGYHTYLAENAAQALAVLAGDQVIELLFSDVVMPGGMNGYELAQLATQQQPDLKVLLTSGFTSKTIAHNGLAKFSAHLLDKPYRKDDLALRVRSLFDDELDRDELA